MVERSLTPLRAERLADLRRRSEAGAVIDWTALAADWGLAQGAVARKAVQQIPGVVVYDGVVSLPGGATVRCLRNGERLSAIHARAEALRLFGALADSGERLNLDAAAKQLGYADAEGLRRLLPTIDGLVVEPRRLVLPDGRVVERLHSGQVAAPRGNPAAETLKAWLRDRAAAAELVTWTAGAAACGYARVDSFRRAVLSLPEVTREGAALVVEGIGTVRIERSNAAKPKPPRTPDPVAQAAREVRALARRIKAAAETFAPTETTRRRAASGAGAERPSKPPAEPPAPRASLSTRAGAPAPAPLSEFAAALLARMESLEVMPAHNDVAAALGWSPHRVGDVMKQLRNRELVADVPGGLRLPSGRVLPRSVEHLRRTVPPRPVESGSDRTAPAAMPQAKGPARVPALADWPRDGQCRFPIGDAHGPEGLTFCCAKTRAGRVYCDHHHAVTHVSPEQASVRSLARYADWVDGRSRRRPAAPAEAAE